jgi:hypothetical protein
MGAYCARVGLTQNNQNDPRATALVIQFGDSLNICCDLKVLENN